MARSAIVATFVLSVCLLQAMGKGPGIVSPRFIAFNLLRSTFCIGVWNEWWWLDGWSQFNFLRDELCRRTAFFFLLFLLFSSTSHILCQNWNSHCLLLLSRIKFQMYIEKNSCWDVPFKSLVVNVRFPHWIAAPWNLFNSCSSV